MALTSGTTSLTDNFRTAVSEVTDAPDLNNSADYEFTLRLDDLAKVTQVLVGTLDIEAVSSRIIVNSYTAILERNEAAQRASKKSDDDQYFLILLKPMSEIDAQIKQYENRLRDKYGDNFIAKAAEEILGKEAAKRLPEEGDEEYRRRMKKKLHDKIFDENGFIKPEYEHADIAQWLRWQKEKEIRKMTEEFLKDGVISAEEKAELDRVHRTGTANEIDNVGFALLDAGKDEDSAEVQESGKAIKKVQEKEARSDNDLEDKELVSVFGPAADPAGEDPVKEAKLENPDKGHAPVAAPNPKS